MFENLSYNIHDILYVKSNFQIPTIPLAFITSSDVKPSLIVAYNPRLRLGANKRAFEYSFAPFRGLVTNIKIKEENEQMKLEFSDDLFKFARQLRAPLTTYQNLHTLILSLLNYQMLLRNHTFIHGAFLSKDDKGLILIAPPDAGKTTTAISLVKKHQFKFLSDDVFVTDGQTEYSYPLDLKVENISLGALLDLSFRRRLELALKNAVWHLPMYPQILSGAWLPPSEVLGSNVLNRKARTEYIFFLHPGKNEITEVEPSLALRRLISIQEYAMLEDTLFQRYIYYTGKASLEELTELRWRLYRQLVGRVRCFDLTASDGRYHDQVAEIVAGAK